MTRVIDHPVSDAPDHATGLTFKGDISEDARRPLHARDMPAHSWVEVDVGNVLKNACTLLARSPGAKLLAVLKANAYGLGAIEIARALSELPTWGVAVATVHEAALLREAGIAGRLLVLRPATPSVHTAYEHFALRPVVESNSFLRRWGGAFHIEIDTGMSRTGVPWDRPRILERLARRCPEGVFTHLHSAEAAPESVIRQLERFEHSLDSAGETTALRHVANSAGVFAVKRHYDLIRPGLFLLGGRSGPLAPQPVPVVAVRTTIISLRIVRRGETVSYGGEWRAERDSTIATLAVGYADGVPRNLGTKAYVLLRGSRCPLVGRVTMDMFMVDVSNLHNPQLGEIATIIGSDGQESISLEQFSEWSGVISYELLTGLGSRLPRIYAREGQTATQTPNSVNDE